MTAAVRRGYVDVDHGQVHVRIAGADRTQRPPLVCLHMSPASGLVYERFAAVAGSDRTVLALDTPGYGGSDPLPPLPTIGDYADVVAQVVEAAGLAGPVDLLGYHTGSLTAVELAGRRPDLVRRVVAVSMPVFTAAELERLHGVYPEEPIFTEDGARLLATWRWFVEFFDVGGANTVEQAARIFHARLSGGERHWWGHHAAFDYDVVPALAQVRSPLLVLNPADDLTEQTRRAAAHLRHGRVEEHPEWTHGFLDNHTRAAAAAVLDFLDGAA
ncbi:MAG: alpha/beta hydrolase [Acidimicrobiales bacterium]|nr:alpha/beta hydrolase [Acidimicrobiales bacterium]